MSQVSLGPAVNDALHDRIGTLLSSVPVRYRGDQAGDPNYILFLHYDERKAREWSDKDDDANDFTAVMQLWSDQARTNQSRAKTIIDSVASNPITVAGFDFMRSELEQNRNMPSLQSDGEENEYAHLLQIRFFYRPTP